MLIVDTDDESPSGSADVSMETVTLKRKLPEDEPVSNKRKRLEPLAKQDDDIIALD